MKKRKPYIRGSGLPSELCEKTDDPEGEVLLHDKQRRAFDKELVDRGLIDVYMWFAGPPVPEDYAVMF